MFKPNNRYLIKTPTGYESFAGIQKKTVSDLYTFNFKDGTHLKCSSKHALLTNKGMVFAKDIAPQDTITGKHIVSIEHESGTFDVYDPVGVDKHSTYYSNGVVSHNTEFLGSSNTLINGAKLGMLMDLAYDPIRNIDHHLKIYEEPIKDHTYTMTVDVAEGLGQDYSAFQIIDVTQVPYKVVGTYRNNSISPYLFPTVIVQAAKLYNDAFILVEINSIGLQVSDTIHFEFGYDNLIKIEQKGKQGQTTTAGYKKRIAYGVKTTSQTKMIGCTNLKTMIEANKLIIPDMDTLVEFTSFVGEKKSFSAEEGRNDDLVMCLVHFGWLTGQRYFKENINSNIRELIQKEQMDLMDADVCPPPVIDDGLAPIYEQLDTDKWIEDKKSKFKYTHEMMKEDLKRSYPFDDFEAWRSRL